MTRARSSIWKSASLALLLGFSFCVLGLASSPAKSPSSSDRAKARIVSLFDRARQAEAARDFREAIRFYDAILQLDSSLAEVWANKGLLLYEVTKYREAEVAFSKAASLKPGLLTPQLFLGILYLKSGDHQKALHHLLGASAIEPHHPQVTYELANVYVQLEEFNKAVSLYRQLLERDPKMEQAWYRLGIAYLNWSKSAGRQLAASPSTSVYRKLLLGDLLAVGGVLLDAEARYREAVEARPGLVDARLALGKFYLDFRPGAESLAAAREQFESAEALAPGDLRCTLLKVRLEVLAGDYPQARTLLRTALRADAAFVRAHVQEFLSGFPEPGKILSALCSETASDEDTVISTGRSKAVEVLTLAARFDDSEIPGARKELDILEEKIKTLGETAESSGLQSYSRRFQQLQRLRKSRRLTSQEKRDLALCAYQLDQFEEALRNLEALPGDETLYWLSLTCRALARQTLLQAIRVNPHSYRAHLLLGDIADDRHDTPQAIAEFEAAVALGVDDPEAHLLLVRYLGSKGQDERALAKASAAVAMYPDHPALNCELGKLLLKKRRPGEAQRAFQRALEADPALAPARAGLADSHAALGDTENAVREMKRALAGDPDGSYHYRLGRWFQLLGLSGEASEAFAVSTELKQKREQFEKERLSEIPQ